jgi:ATP-dependent Clp protease ATP-binding subunit ClpC
MFERFTDRARRVVVLAQEEARLLGHTYIGTEHILLGLLAEEEGLGAQALVKSGVSLSAAREKVVAVIGEGPGTPPSHIPFTPRAKKVLELALREAIALGHNYIGTEHQLLGLVREGEGVAAKVLTSLGVTLEGLRGQILDLLSATPAQPEAGGRLTTRRQLIPPVPPCRHEPAHLVYLPVEIGGSGDLPPLSVRVVRCSECGTTLGVIPA